ncbi:MAG: LysE family translocator [Rhodoferax sp.]|nr:LysE family translocator [Rhodoferax sp.]
MTTSSWILYLTVVVLSTLSPGPAVLLSVSNAVGLGPRASAFSSLGNVIGLFFLSAVAMTGIGAVLQSSTLVFGVLKVLGALYLVYLGIRKWHSSASGFEVAATVSADRTPAGLFSQGLVIALTNPKALLFFSALFPQFIARDQPLALQFVALTSTLMVFSFAALMAYALVAHGARQWLASPGRTQAFNKISGVIFVLLGLGLLGLTAPAR